MKQALEAVRDYSSDEDLQLAVLHQATSVLTRMDLRQCPPAVAERVERVVQDCVHRGARDLLRPPVDSPRSRARQRSLRACIARAPEPVVAALKAAAAVAVTAHPAQPGSFSARIRVLLQRPLVGAVKSFRNDFAQAARILILTTGPLELATDILLLERLPSRAVTVAMPGSPTAEFDLFAQARAVGLDPAAQVLATGSPRPAALLEQCSPEFRAAFCSADLILAKGAANFAALECHRQRPLYFLFVPGCPVIAEHVGVAEDALVLRSSRASTNDRSTDESAGAAQMRASK